MPASLNSVPPPPALTVLLPFSPVFLLFFAFSGQVPVLTTEAGTQLAQSSAIIRYIARKYNFEGADLEQSALIDAGFEAVLDCKRSYFQNKSNEEKTKEFWSAGLLKHLQGLEKNIVGPFFAGEKLSYVDVALYYLIWQLATENREAVEAAVGQVPKVKAVYEAVPKLPQVAEYLAQRKETAF